MSKSVILVVEDHPLNMELVRDILTIHDYIVVEATTAQEALEQVRIKHPDLIIMDIQLPGTDGLSLARMLKSDPQTKDIAIIALTAHAMKGDEGKAYQAGCSGYISKPIDTRSFPQTISQFLSSPKRAPATDQTGQ